MIYNVVSMVLRDGMMDAFLAEARRIRPLVLAERGCLMYDYTREIETAESRQEPVNPKRITLYEKWASLADLEAHSTTAHMRDFVEKVRPLRESVSIRTGTEAF